MALTERSLPAITQGEILREVSRDRVRLTDTTHDPHTILPEHSHQSAALALVLAGSFEERVGDDLFHCEPMSLLYKPPEAPHSNRYGPSGARTVLVALDSTMFRRVADFSPSARERAIQVRSPTLTARALSLCPVGREIDDTSTEDWEDLLGELLHRGLGPEEEEPGPPPSWLDRIEDAIRERFAEALGLSILAKEAGVHPVHLARVYRLHHGCSIGDSLRRRRIEHAVTRLRSDSPDLAELALECGFADQSHLTREFGREVGTSPGRFRRLRQLLDSVPGPRAS